MLEPRELDNRQLNPHLGVCAAKKQIPISRKPHLPVMVINDLVPTTFYVAIPSK